MNKIKCILAAFLFAGACGVASAAVIAEKTFTAVDGFSDGVSITGIDGWTTAGNSPDWVAKEVSGAGYTLNASTVDSRVVCELGQTWSDTSNNAFNFTVDFSVPNSSYSTKTELFSIALYDSAGGATSGFGTGARVYWDSGRFMVKGRNGGSTSAYAELDHASSGATRATLYLRLEKTSTANQLELTYSFDDFVSYRTATMEYTAIYGDTDGLYFQMQSEDAAKNGGAGILVHSVKVEKDVEWVDPYERPFIIARMSERPAILEKIANHSWAQSQRNTIVNDADDIVDDHQANREAFIRRLPLELVSGELRFKRDLEEKDDGFDPLGEAEKCAVAYYLTQDEKYAKAAADIFHNVIEALSNTTPFTGTTESWMTKHILGESRTKTYRIAVTYDFIHPYLKTNPTVYEWTASTGLTSKTYGNTQFDDAEYVFEKYVELIKTRGYAGNNWSANEAQGLVPAALAIDDATKRANALRYYIDLDTSRQDSIKSDADEYPAPGDIWPESLHYSVEVNNIHPILMTMVDRYDPSINLYGKYPNVIQSVSRPYQLQFPNNTPPSFGDRGSMGLPDPDGVYEIIYAQAKKNGAQWLMDIYGPLINESIANGSHSRNRAGGKFYYANLLWGADEITEPAEAKIIYRTDTLPHAGMALQRNLSSTGNVNNDLMCYVAGAAYTHSHADGMNIELFGNGYVVGADAAKDSYGTDLHENYYRVFAAHNTIIVNGASQGSGGWQGVGINTVQVEAMEPATREKALSSDISYTCTTFEDNKGSDAEATQQRTLSLIRTSPTTGYYVDIFRSDSSKSDEFHDYLYHNIGELLEINKASDGTALPLTSEPNRFQNDIGDGYKQPGWRYFENVYNGASTENVKAIFTTGALSGGNRYMDVHMAGDSGREYAKVMAPPVRHHTQTYQFKDCPTLVVRKTGSAWNKPFAVVYEPHMGAKDSGSVQSVEQLISGGVVYGMKVVSDVDGNTITQYVLSNPSPTDTNVNSTYDFEFTGRFAVITVNTDGTGSLYMGDGSSLRYKNVRLQAPSGRMDATTDFQISLEPSLTYGNGGTPGTGDAWPISRSTTTRIEAENFDQGDAGIVYSDTTEGNQGGQYRTTDVDVEASSDTGGGFNVGWTKPDEWLQYTTEVEKTGLYDMTIRYSRATLETTGLNISMNGGYVSEQIDALGTGDWGTYASLTTRVELQGGAQTMRLHFVDGSINVNWLEFTPVASPIITMVDLGSMKGWDVVTSWSDGNAAHGGADYVVPATGNLISPSETASFPGYSLTVESGGKFQVRAEETASEIITVNGLIFNGGADFAAGNVAELSAGSGSFKTNVLDGSIENSGCTRILSFDQVNGNPYSRGMEIRSKISGTGTLQAWEGQSGQGGDHVLIENEANTFSGTWEAGTGSTLLFANAGSVGSADIEVLETGKLEIQGFWQRAATLTVADTATTKVDLGAYTWSVSSLVIGTTAVADGFYTVAMLNGLSSNTVFAGSGTLLVGEGALDAPLAYWPMDNGSGAVATDASGNGHDGTLENGVVWGSDATRDSYASFDGVNDRIATDVTVDITAVDKDFTWAYWVNNQKNATDSDQKNGVIVGNRYPALGSDLHFMKQTPTKQEVRVGGTNQELNYDDLPVGEWHHCAVVKSGSTLTYYRDGVEVVSRQLTTYAPATLPFFIGGDPNTGSANEHFNGFIDDVVLYASALPADQIVKVMNGLDIGTPEQPVLEVVPSVGGDLSFSWTNGAFKLQYRTNLTEGTWVDYPAGTTGDITVAPTNSEAFFRLIEQ